MMGIDKAIEVLRNTAWLGSYEQVDSVTEAIAIAEWCMRHSKKEFEGRNWRDGCTKESRE